MYEGGPGGGDTDDVLGCEVGVASGANDDNDDDDDDDDDVEDSGSVGVDVSGIVNGSSGGERTRAGAGDKGSLLAPTVGTSVSSSLGSETSTTVLYVGSLPPAPGPCLGSSSSTGSRFIISTITTAWPRVGFGCLSYFGNSSTSTSSIPTASPRVRALSGSDTSAVYWTTIGGISSNLLASSSSSIARSPCSR